jgi:hypothetical protein
MAQDAVGPRFEFHAWDSFVSRYWQRSPAVLRTPLAGDLQTLDYFAAAVAAATAWREGMMERPHDIRLFLDRGAVSTGHLGQLLPTAEDADFRTYIRRIDSYSSMGWSLVINGLQQFSPQLFCAARCFLDGLYTASGHVPSGMTDCFLIVGSYSEAPTRIHKDTASVFTLIYEGRKGMRTWPFRTLLPFCTNADPVHSHVPLGLNPDQVLDQSVLLDGLRGEILYWPSDQWHCAISDSEPHVTVHLASYEDGNSLRTAESVLSASLASAVRDYWLDPSEYRSHMHHDSPSLFPAEPLEKISGALRELPVRLQKRALHRASATNFELVPPLRPIREWNDGQIVATDERFPTLYEHSLAASDHILVAANGHVSQVPDHPWVRSLLDTVNASRLEDNLTLSHILASHNIQTSNSVATGSRQVLSFLDAAGALVSVKDGLGE